MKKELQKELDKAHEMLRALSDKVNRLPEQEFEVGKWYKFKYGILNYNGTKGAFGFWSDTEYQKATWKTGVGFDGFYKAERPATPSEVQEALTKEAVKIGFKEGVSVKDVTLSSNNVRVCESNVYYNGFEYDQLMFGPCCCVYRKGQWAEIVKDEPITICGKVVNYDNDCGLFSVDGQNYLPEDLSVLAKLMQKGQIKSLNVGRNGQEKVDLQLIESLINRINKG